MRDYAAEMKLRVEFIKQVLADAGAAGVVFGNSGGKDCALVGILCKMACDNTLGVIMPCGSKSNYLADKTDAEALAQKFGIASRIVDLTEVKERLLKSVASATTLSGLAVVNIAPRLRMTTLYAIAASENRLVAGTGNRSERYIGYFTKWGDGGCDFNPIADLTVAEVYGFLRYLGAPENIISKPPSAGLFDGQTDEGDLGITYHDLDTYLLTGEISEHNRQIIDRYHKTSGHKRRLPRLYRETDQ
jgi:NAD+ synthase